MTPDKLSSPGLWRATGNAAQEGTRRNILHCVCCGYCTPRSWYLFAVDNENISAISRIVSIGEGLALVWWSGFDEESGRT